MKKSLFVAATALLGACATSYNDAPGSLWNPFDNQSVVVQQLNEQLIEIRAGGNAYTSTARVENFIRLKAAQETLNRGFTHFLPVSEEDRSVSGTSYSSSNYVDYKGVVQNRISENKFYKPGKATQVLMLSTEEAPPHAFSAQIVYDQLAPKYIK